MLSLLDVESPQRRVNRVRPELARQVAFRTETLGRVRVVQPLLLGPAVPVDPKPAQRARVAPAE